MRAGDLAAHGIGDALGARAAAPTALEVRERARPVPSVSIAPTAARANAIAVPATDRAPRLSPEARAAVAELRRRLEVAAQRRYVRSELDAIASIVDRTQVALLGMQHAITELTSR